MGGEVEEREGVSRAREREGWQKEERHWRGSKLRRAKGKRGNPEAPLSCYQSAVSLTSASSIPNMSPSTAPIATAATTTK